MAPAAATTTSQRLEVTFTETYQRFCAAPPALREAKCLEVVFPATLKPIREGDLFAGRLPPDNEFSWDINGLGYYCRTDLLATEILRDDLDEATRNRYREIIEFWKTENTALKIRQACSDAVKTAMPSDNWMTESGPAFPLYRIAGAYLDFDKLLKKGIPGLRSEINAAADRPNADGSLFEGMTLALDILVASCKHYSRQAEALARAEQRENRQMELFEMSTALENIAGQAPRTLREALQLAWLYILHAGVVNYGRMDLYAGDFLANDLAAGRLTEEKALALLQSLWQLMADRKTTFNGRVIVGGKGRRNEIRADRFALLAMEATRTVKEIEPQLSLRFYEGQDPSLYRTALDVLGEGRTYPMLYNDDVNVPAVAKAFEVPLSEAEQYMPLGCGEYVLDHISIGSPNGVINLLKTFEITLHNGRDPLSGKPMGLALGEFSSFGSFDELWGAYTRQVAHYVDALATQEEVEYQVCGRTAAWLFTTMLYDDCIGRGKAVFSGGVRYLGGTLETYGNINTADTLTALKQLVYDTKRLTPEQALAALDADFAGYSPERALMQQCPKYGNDNEAADAMTARVHDHVCTVTRNQRNRTGLHSYLVVIINNHANTILGRATAASADGRKSGSPMANANNPAPGMDRSGLTAFLNSLLKLDPSIHAGSVQNMKFSPELFSASMRPKLEALLKTYFVKGGTQAMISVVRRGDLEAALKDPEKYQNLMVRVGGFSARFVELMKDVQQEVLHRTLY